MKKILSTITALAAAAGIAGMTGLAAGAESGNLVVLGDSITSGYGLPGYVSGDNYSAQDSFANQLAGNFSDCRNFAVDGRTSGELLTALDDPAVSSALAGADVVLISIGGNDFLQPMISAATEKISENEELLQTLKDSMSSGDTAINADNYLDIMMDFADTMMQAADSVDIAATGQNIRGVLAGVSSASPDSRKLILTVYDPFEGVSGMELFDVMAREKLAELNSEITAAAAEYGAEVVDVYASFKGHAVEYTNISSMDIHPSKDGHAVIYSLLSDILFPAAETIQPADTAVTDSTDTAATGSHKGSPDTGVEGIAVLAGAALLAAAGAFISRKR